MVKALTQLLIERDLQAGVNPLHVFPTEREHFTPQPEILFIARVQLGRFFENRGIDSGMSRSEAAEPRVLLDRRNFALQTSYLLSQLGQTLGAFFQFLVPLLGLAFVGWQRLGSQLLQTLLLLDA
jgi:hypothetical protein